MSNISNARKLRRDQTKAETVFWNAVRNRQFHDLKWRRQSPVGNYIADFLCEAKKVIVELDGQHHGTDAARIYDETRTEVLGQNGYRVIRFLNDEILNNLNGVLDSLAHELRAGISPHPTAPNGASTSPRGEV